MGNGFGSYERVEYESGASRLLNSIFMAICVAPLLILATCGWLGWNERRAVCSQKAISAGKEVVETVGCNDALAGNGTLILFTCDIDKGSLPKLEFPGVFSGVQVQAVGIKFESYMWQCVEKETKHEQKTQGGGKTTTYTYTYRLEWKDKLVDSSNFGKRSSQAADTFRSGCGSKPNPATWAFQPLTKYATRMKIGAFTSTMTNKVPLDTPVSVPAQFQTPGGWTAHGQGVFSKGSLTSPQIGDTKVTLKSNDPSSMTATVLGKNDAGTIDDWTAPSSWLCSGFQLNDLRMGSIDKDTLFERLASEENVLTWIYRLAGFAVMWIAFGLCFGPLEVAGDCIPCVGPCIGDGIAAVTCCIACLPATACTLGVAGLVWVVMRPLIGLPCMLAFVVIFGGFGYFISKRRAAKGARQIKDPNSDGVEFQQFSATTVAAQPLAPQPPVAVAVAVAQPVAPQPRQMQVQAPMGCVPGQTVQFQTPEGTQLSAQVPAGVTPGGLFLVNY